MDGFCPKSKFLLSLCFYRNYGHFRKGLVYGFCPKIEISLNAVFYRNYVRKKNRFSIFWIENNHFKTKKLKF